MDQSRTIIVKCPSCGIAVPWTEQQTFKPFCSERCRLIDLGDWATEAHKIAGEDVMPDDEYPESGY